MPNIQESNGRYWSNHGCVICWGCFRLRGPKESVTDKVCDTCRKYDMATTAKRITGEARLWYFAQSLRTLRRSLRGDRQRRPFSRAMWRRTSLGWLFDAFRGYRWIPNTGVRTIGVIQTATRRDD